MRKTFVLIIAFAGLFGGVSMAAEQCSNASLRGRYGFHGLAFIVQSSGAPATPRSIIGVFTMDGKGSWTASLLIDDNGVISRPPDPGRAGTYTINADCTGTLYPSSGGSVELVVVDKGNEFYQMRSNPANIVLFGTTKKVFPGNGD